MKKYVFVAIIASLCLSSCVSKKKFDELALAKIEADENIENLNNSNKTLDEKLNSMTDEYNAIRYKLTYSNAQKDSYIDSLTHITQNMQTEQVVLKAEIEENNNKLTNVSTTRQKQIQNLELKISKIENEKKNLVEKIRKIQTDSRFNLEKKANEVITINEKLKAKDIEINKLEKEVNVHKSKAAWLRKVNSNIKKEVSKLNNQVKLLKKAISN